MPRDDSRPPRDPESKRASAGSQRPGGERRSEPRALAGSASWMRRGHSGYGIESMRPYLRAQIAYQKLLGPTFPPEIEPDEDDDDADMRRR